ncbi:MAG: hypothetical protein RLZZ168_1422 [Cyanobacteriota bacterium]
MGLQGQGRGGGVKAFDDPALIAQDQAHGLEGGLTGAAGGTLQPPVGLPAGGAAQVPMAAGGSGHVGQGVGAGRHGLGLEGFAVPGAGHLRTHHGRHVVLQRQMVHRQEPSGHLQHAHAAAIAAAIDDHGRIGCGVEVELRGRHATGRQRHHLPGTPLAHHSAIGAAQPPRAGAGELHAAGITEERHPNVQLKRGAPFGFHQPECPGLRPRPLRLHPTQVIAGVGGGASQGWWILEHGLQQRPIHRGGARHQPLQPEPRRQRPQTHRCPHEQGTQPQLLLHTAQPSPS